MCTPLVIYACRETGKTGEMAEPCELQECLNQHDKRQTEMVWIDFTCAYVGVLVSRVGIGLQRQF